MDAKNTDKQEKKEEKKLKKKKEIGKGEYFLCSWLFVVDHTVTARRMSVILYAVLFYCLVDMHAKVGQTPITKKDKKKKRKRNKETHLEKEMSVTGSMFSLLFNESPAVSVRFV